jgi:sec-independent protein translocase protein TatA
MLKISKRCAAEENMQLPGGWEWIIVLIIVILLFGPGRLSKIAGEIGRGIKEFRSGLQGGEEEETDANSDEVS